MLYLDTNVILRYLLEDCEKFMKQSRAYVEEQDVYIKNEVLAEVVYVLQKTYSVPKETIRTTLEALLQNDNIQVDSYDAVILSLKLFEEKKIDFVDALLCAYHHVLDYQVVSFDKRLNKCLK